MSPERRQELIETYRILRKEAYEIAAPKVTEYFYEASAALNGVKHASECVDFDHTLLRHLVEP
jgi:hypothetical protein